MIALKAHVENGRVVLDEPMDLPDGTYWARLLHKTNVRSRDQSLGHVVRWFCGEPEVVALPVSERRPTLTAGTVRAVK